MRILPTCGLPTRILPTWILGAFCTPLPAELPSAGPVTLAGGKMCSLFRKAQLAEEKVGLKKERTDGSELCWLSVESGIHSSYLNHVEMKH